MSLFLEVRIQGSETHECRCELIEQRDTNVKYTSNYLDENNLTSIRDEIFREEIKVRGNLSK